MARVLILYDSTDGHTRKIAGALAGKLRYDGGCPVEVIEAQQVSPKLELADYDGVIVVASTHVGRYQRAVTRWVRLHAAELNGRPSAFVSIYLQDRPHARPQEVEDTMRRFRQRAGWRPTLTTTVAGAVPYTRYNWLQKWVMKRRVAKVGGGQDTTRDYEYTDWDDVRSLAREFARQLAGGIPTGALP